MSRYIISIKISDIFYFGENRSIDIPLNFAYTTNIPMTGGSNMRHKFLILAVFLLIFTAGCQITNKSVSPPKQTPQSTAQTVKLYYGNTGNEKLLFEQRKVKINAGADKYKAVMEELLKGPQSKDLRANITSGTKVYGTIRQNNRLIVDFSQEFNRFGGSIAEIIGVASVVNTMTQFSEIKEVKILVNGEEYIGLSGEPRGFMRTFSNPKT